MSASSTASKEEILIGKLSPVLTPINVALDGLKTNSESLILKVDEFTQTLRQEINTLRQENTKLHQEMNKNNEENNVHCIRLQTDIATLHSAFLNLQESLFKTPTVEKTIKGKTPAVVEKAEKTEKVEKVEKADKVDKAVEKVIEKKVIKMKADKFLLYALEHEEEFGLRTKFPFILDTEAKFAATANETVEVFRTKDNKNFKNFANDVWKNGKIEDKIKEINTQWTVAKSIIVPSASLEADV